VPARAAALRAPQRDRAVPTAPPLTPSVAGTGRERGRRKGERMLEAAVEVLLRDGVHACTVRAIAAAAGVPKSALHYYFADVDDVVDAAMLLATERWVAWLRVAADRAGEPGPTEAFWRVVDHAVEPFAQGDRSLLPLWLEYFALRSRQGRLAPLRRAHDVLVDYMAELLAAAGVGEPRERAQAVTAYLFGASMQESLAPLDQQALRRQVGALCGLPAPDPRS
jgi:AcrR family transcriptional regulator